jgi:hypothetical protein
MYLYISILLLRANSLTNAQQQDDKRVIYTLNVVTQAIFLVVLYFE